MLWYPLDHPDDGYNPRVRLYWRRSADVSQVDAYGLDDAQRHGLLPLLARRTRTVHDFLAGQAARGIEPWATHWREGHGEVWRADADYIAQHQQRWALALDVEATT